MREEENKNVSKNSSWKRVFRKKWFFPAVYLTAAALILTGVLWYQNLANNTGDIAQDPVNDPYQTSTDNPNNVTPYDNYEPETAPVMQPVEQLSMPVVEKDQAVIVTKFFDYSASDEDQEKGLVLYNNKYYQSTGIDIAAENGETFDVAASLSGTVTEVKEDPLLGNVVKISHDQNVSTYYASLDHVLVEAGAQVKQGDVIGTAGRNLFGQEDGIHVYFELRNGDKQVNPESYFNKPLTAMKEIQGEEAGDSEKAPATDENGDDEKTDDESESSISMANA